MNKLNNQTQLLFSEPVLYLPSSVTTPAPMLPLHLLGNSDLTCYKKLSMLTGSDTALVKCVHQRTRSKQQCIHGSWSRNFLKHFKIQERKFDSLRVSRSFVLPNQKNPHQFPQHFDIPQHQCLKHVRNSFGYFTDTNCNHPKFIQTTEALLLSASQSKNKAPIFPSGHSMNWHETTLPRRKSCLPPGWSCRDAESFQPWSCTKRTLSFLRPSPTAQPGVQVLSWSVLGNSAALCRARSSTQPAPAT